MDKGAHFRRCDFQVHSPRDLNWDGDRPVSEDDRKEYAKRFIASCREKGLDAVAVTDHHDFGFFSFIRAAAEQEVDAEGKPIPPQDRVVVFPGMELTLNSPDDRVRALAEFRQRSLNWDVLRKLCLDVILEQLQDYLDATKRELSRMWSPTRTMLRQFFLSEEIWGEILKVFTQVQSVEKIRALAGEEHDDFIELCCSYLNGHCWQAMKGKAEPRKVFKALKAMAAVFGECAKDKNDTEGQSAASQLFEAARKGDAEAVDLWARKHARWDKEYSASNLEESVRALALRTARFF